MGMRGCVSTLDDGPGVGCAAVVPCGGGGGGGGGVVGGVVP